jgi:hypothetical protein
LVRYRSGTGAAERADIRADVYGRLLDRLPAPGLELVHVGPVGGATVRELERRPDVLYAEPNNRVSIAATPGSLLRSPLGPAEHWSAEGGRRRRGRGHRRT